MKRALVLYVPVIHSGYIRLIERYTESIDTIYVLGQELIDELRDPVAEIRQLDPGLVVELLNTAFSGLKVVYLDSSNMSDVKASHVVTLNDVVCRRFAERYLKKDRIEFDTCFLRWDSSNVMSSSDIEPDRQVSFNEVRELVEAAVGEGRKTTSWWREVGIVAFRDGKVLGCEHNTHLPDEHSVFMEGDPRDSIKTGTNPGMSSAIHAEQKLVARLGRPVLEGASVLLTTFPCVPCVQMLSMAHIKRLYYMSGNAYLDVDQVLRSFGIEIVYVNPPIT